MFEVYYCLGYMLGYVVFFSCVYCIVIVGDVLFVGLIGWIDFLCGNYEDFVCLIKEKLWLFGDDVMFVFGYGLVLMFGDECCMNLFVFDKVFG